MPVCGLLAGSKLDEVAKTFFHVRIIIEPTWGGNGGHGARYLHHQERNLVQNAATVGAYLIGNLAQCLDRIW